MIFRPLVRQLHTFRPLPQDAHDQMKLGRRRTRVRPCTRKAPGQQVMQLQHTRIHDDDILESGQQDLKARVVGRQRAAQFAGHLAKKADERRREAVVEHRRHQRYTRHPLIHPAQSSKRSIVAGPKAKFQCPQHRHGSTLRRHCSMPLLRARSSNRACGKRLVNVSRIPIDFARATAIPLCLLKR
jgi:hypothetical protein